LRVGADASWHIFTGPLSGLAYFTWPCRAARHAGRAAQHALRVGLCQPRPVNHRAGSCSGQEKKPCFGPCRRTASCMATYSGHRAAEPLARGAEPVRHHGGGHHQAARLRAAHRHSITPRARCSASRASRYFGYTIPLASFPAIGSDIVSVCQTRQEAIGKGRMDLAKSLPCDFVSRAQSDNRRMDLAKVFFVSNRPNAQSLEVLFKERELLLILVSFLTLHL
jgi:hypothetical protein